MVVVVGSQGALGAFEQVLESLPAAIPFSIVFDLHRGEGQWFTEGLLARRGALSVCRAIDGMAPERGAVYVTPPDSQVLISSERRLGIVERSGELPWHRCVDALLESAAEAYGQHLIAVVLSGRLDGGAQGVRAVKAHGGRVLVQDPSTAAAPAMPNAALATGCVDFSLPAGSIGHGLVALSASTGAAKLSGCAGT